MYRVVAIGPFWDRVWERRKPILVLSATATLLVGVVAFLLPPWYRAEVEVLPPSSDDANIGSLSMFFRGMAIPGVRIPTRVTASEMFMKILESRRISEQVVERFDLMKPYKKKLMVDAIRELGRHTEFTLTQSGSIKIAVEDRDRQRAANIANAYVEFLDQFNRESRSTKGRRTRVFIEERLGEIRRELAVAERQLVEYQARHRGVAMTPGASSAIEEGARLIGRRMALQLRLGVVRNYSEGSEEEVQIQQELVQLERQIAALPGVGLELARRVRDVRTLEQVLAFLNNQFEDARIAEARNLRTVEFLDVASAPERKSRPKRLTMIASAFLLSLVLGAGLAIRDGEKQGPPAIRAVAGG